ncbi:MAG: DNA-directed RNA polymerase subunit beta', partial [Anaeroplasmataceae bacterium]|nr:DNA-directed RNA polymerase subunit beta' [Anaeroplasmataceae bacterium]
LGKRVDYSGRSVIVVGPSLKMYQCGIPKEMALTLFKPFVLRELIKAGNSIAVASKACDNQDDSVWGILEEVIREHPVLLNRAPTLHRLGIQAFEPVLIEGKAIRLHPLVCTPFNADFDGDQMAVHVPLSLEAQAEARLLMLASNNILNPKDGKPVVTPSQDMILGNYYLTLERKGEPNEGHFYKDFDEAYMSYKNGNITLHTRIFIDPSYLPAEKFANNFGQGKYLFTTLGKMIFNSILPDEFPYLNEPTEDNLCVATPNRYFLDSKNPNNTYEALLAHDEVAPFKKKNIARIIAEVFKRFHITETSRMLDRIKDLGFKYSTIAGLTISAADVLDYKGKQTRISQADAKIDQITMMYDLGQLTNKERKKLVEKEWSDARNEIQEGLWAELAKQKDNHIFMMADSGSRGNASNFAQLAGMRGLMANTAGETIEVPVKANFREGLTVSEFFISTHGSRKGSTDTALKTAESGYLTRRLVDVSQDVIISCEDCNTEKGTYVEDIVDDGGKVVVTVADRVIGRYAAKDLFDKNTGELICKRNELFTEEMAAQITEAGIKSVCIRSNLTCNATSGVCMKCYGRNLATNKVVEVGEAVGTVAAQSIGEPGTQLTMRTFHTGGVASAADITQGLPRVQELFEARKPKGKATISEIDGTVTSIEKTKNGLAIIIENDKEEKAYTVDATSELLVKVGSTIKRGEKLMKGSIHPKELLRIKDAEAVQKYIVEEVQKVYRSQSVEISDKHIEIIVRQMMRKLMVVQEGDTHLLPGRDVSIQEYTEACRNVIVNGGTLPTAKPLLLGITKAALACQSFLSACSFQETTRILTQAAIQSKTDHLIGLKENVIIGGLIPAGTGVLEEDEFYCEYRPQDIESEEDEEVYPNDEEDEDLEDELDDFMDEDGEELLDDSLDSEEE